MLWDTKEYWFENDFFRLSFYIARPSMFGISMTINRYMIELQLGWFGFYVEFY